MSTQREPGRVAQQALVLCIEMTIAGIPQPEDRGAPLPCSTGPLPGRPNHPCCSIPPKPAWTKKDQVHHYYHTRHGLAYHAPFMYIQCSSC